MACDLISFRQLFKCHLLERTSLTISSKQCYSPAFRSAFLLTLLIILCSTYHRLLYPFFLLNTFLPPLECRIGTLFCLLLFKLKPRTVPGMCALINIYDTGSGFNKLPLWWKMKVQNNYRSAKIEVCPGVTGSQHRGNHLNHQGRGLLLTLDRTLSGRRKSSIPKQISAMFQSYICPDLEVGLGDGSYVTS